MAIQPPARIALLEHAYSPEFFGPQRHFVAYPVKAGLQACLIEEKQPNDTLRIIDALTVVPDDVRHSILDGQFNSAELYATPALFRQLWPKLLYAMAVEALVEQKQASREWTGTLPTKGEVTAWLAATHRRGAVGHTDKINKRVHRRLRSFGTQTRFECLDQEQDGLCVHETILPNDFINLDFVDPE